MMRGEAQMSETTGTDVAGRTIVVTGAGSGIGRALAEGFLRDGARVVAADIRPEGLAPLEARGALVQVVDVSVRDQVRGLLERARAATGRVDVLFNNAGFGSRRAVADLEEGEFERMIAVHLFGTIHGMRFAIPIMREQGRGRIVNTLSRAAEVCGPLDSAYSAAKAATWAATRSAARECADADILINGLIPGPTNTAIWGRDMPTLQPPEAVYPTALMLATLPAGGPTGRVFWNEKEYPLMDPANAAPNRSGARR
jgi:NAD(P)-dependent dehydrogenase (short-subunit alcohol dehydrogenase family)